MKRHWAVVPEQQGLSLETAPVFFIQARRSKTKSQQNAINAQERRVYSSRPTRW